MTYQVALLRDAVMQTRVIDALEALAQRITGIDIVVVFYCGHGTFDDDSQCYPMIHETCLQ